MALKLSTNLVSITLEGGGNELHPVTDVLHLKVT